MKRPFWMHQLVEYILGLGLILMGAQSPEPLVPCSFGVLVLLNAAIAAGPLAAFRVVPRKQHRIADFVVAALMIVGGVVLHARMDSSAQLGVIGIGVVIAFVAWKTNFADKIAKPAAPGSPGDRVGRMAGRAAASGVRAYRNRK